MQVKEIMTRNVEFARRDTLVTEAAERMRSHNIGMLPVWDNDQLLGIVTDRDITVRATANKSSSRIGSLPGCNDSGRCVLLRRSRRR